MHSHCAHDLRYCGTCDMVWCANCKREWGGHRHSYNWYGSYLIPCSAGNDVITGLGSGDSVSVSTNDHALHN